MSGSDADDDDGDRGREEGEQLLMELGRNRRVPKWNTRTSIFKQNYFLSFSSV